VPSPVLTERNTPPLITLSISPDRYACGSRIFDGRCPPRPAAATLLGRRPDNRPELANEEIVSVGQRGRRRKTKPSIIREAENCPAPGLRESIFFPFHPAANCRRGVLLHHRFRWAPLRRRKNCKQPVPRPPRHLKTAPITGKTPPSQKPFLLGVFSRFSLAG
jgi:hypothetical protein